MRQVEGKIIIKTGFENKSATNLSIMEELDKLTETEQYLNSKVSAEIYRRWGVAVRFHIVEKK